MANKIIKVVKKLCFAFISVYGLDVMLSSINILIPINIITLLLVMALGTPGIIGLVVIYFII